MIQKPIYEEIRTKDREGNIKFYKRELKRRTPCQTLVEVSNYNEKLKKSETVTGKCGIDTAFVCDKCGESACHGRGHIVGIWKDGKPFDICRKDKPKEE